ncbi:DUF222 domain-containing protein [Nocardia sp. NBC_00511]|uniref:HNH endonuclease signature motif containing protein n=1 Tax=Nocardia sp. NBC_00511 TaxID=2903591 RepID=UPI0030E594E2
MNRGGETREAAAAVHVAALSDEVDFLAEDNLDPMSDSEVVKLLQEMESCTRRMAAVQHRVLNQIEMRGIPAQSGLKSMPRFLEHTLHLSAADARARCRAATLLGMRELPGQTLPPWLPWTAAAQSVGLVSAEHARVIGRIMDRLPVKLDVEQRETVEFQLAEFATNTTPDDLPKIGDRILAYLDPDGSLTEDEDRQRGRGVTVGKRRVDGMSPLSGEITTTLRELLEPVLAKLARPGMCNPSDPESPWAPEHVDRDVLDAAASRDRRSTAQRNHDALVAFLRPERGPANLGDHRGLPVSTILTMSVAELEARAGVATAASGGSIPLPEALRLAEKSTPFLAIFDHNGMPLHLGQVHRLANPAQRLALIAAERGCTRPGCNAPATLSAVHHITEWCKGGPTDIQNLTLACDACHALVNDTPNGWKTIVMPPDSPFAGRTGWIAPPPLDPTGTPKVNTRHHVGELAVATLTELRGRSARQTRRRPGPPRE